MKYAITFKEDGLEDPSFKYTASQVAKTWCELYHETTFADGMVIMDETGKLYKAVCGIGYALKSIK